MSKQALYGYTYHASKELGDKFDGPGGSAHRRHCKVIGYDGRRSLHIVLFGGQGRQAELITKYGVVFNPKTRGMFNRKQLMELPDLDGHFTDRWKHRTFHQFILAAGPRTDTDDHLFLRPKVGDFKEGLSDIKDLTIDFQTLSGKTHYNKNEIAKTSYSNRKIHFDTMSGFDGN